MNKYIILTFVLVAFVAIAENVVHGEDDYSEDLDERGADDNDDGGDSVVLDQGEDDDKDDGGDSVVLDQGEADDNDDGGIEKRSTRSGWQKQALSLHNKFRKCHGVPPMSLSDKLNKSAQRCANYLASIKKMEHLCTKKFGLKVGENLSSGSRGGLGKDAQSAGAKATRNWYSEVTKYNYNKNNFQYTSGHFTQVIWKKTTQVGMGYATNGDFTIVVAHYSPSGNFAGEFKKNVPHLRTKSACI